MERTSKFIALSIINLVAAVIVIKMAGGQPLGSMSGWGGVLLLAFVAMVIALLFYVFKTLIGGTYDPKQVLGLAAGCTLAVIVGFLLFGMVGLEWLRDLRMLLRSGGIWWPVVILIASLIETLLLTPKRRRVTTR